MNRGLGGGREKERNHVGSEMAVSLGTSGEEKRERERRVNGGAPVERMTMWLGD